ncbi:alpha-amylase family glycosyl hydrolase [Desertihabitans aurantiacus]|uniref:alpha-amylase family glycosyl hydrolase n=1 Tax=Desertihabitans aurantiacus TaxID=2282477 RepID=UPI000DF735B3|nr:alpha-amylase family glycosyl hydrolase [Desertihabitans aurantiacus]
MAEPDWVQHALWWHVYALGAAGAVPGPPTHAEPHGLDRLEPWLDHVISLGLSGIALGPVFRSETHGYDTLDHRVVDERLGGDAAFDRLVAAAKQRGLRIALDGVFNHVAARHERQDWLLRDEHGQPVPFEGHGGLLTLDHGRQDVRAEVTDIMRTWLDRGADAWRLDAAYATPTDFWAAVLPEVRRTHPEAWFFGEVIHGDHADVVQASTMDSVTQYELWKAIWSSLVDRNPHELAWTLGRHAELVPSFVPVTFVGNHDVTRLASRLDDPDLVALAVVALLTLPGTPLVYAGDELGATGVKEERFGGDDAVRPELPPTPGAGDEVIRGTYHHLISLRRQHPWLHRAHLEVDEVTRERLVYTVRSDTSALRVALDLTAHSWDVDTV